jgi:hypothetical protein
MSKPSRNFNVFISWDTAPCSPYVNQRFVGTYHLHLQVISLTQQEISVLVLVLVGIDYW